MAISRPDMDWNATGTDPEGGVHSPPERDRVQARAASRAHPREADGSATPDGEGAQVLTFPADATSEADRSGTVVPIADTDVVPVTSGRAPATQRRELAGRWVAETRAATTAALDGSVWRARPSALRDIHARAQRSEWTDAPVLVVAGQVYGWVAVIVVAALYAGAEIVKRPTRLALVILVTCVIWLASTSRGDAPAIGVTGATDVNVTLNGEG